MKKRLSWLVWIALMNVGLAGCSGNEPEQNQQEQDQQAQAEVLGEVNAATFDALYLGMRHEDALALMDRDPDSESEMLGMRWDRNDGAYIRIVFEGGVVTRFSQSNLLAQTPDWDVEAVQEVLLSRVMDLDEIQETIGVNPASVAISGTNALELRTIDWRGASGAVTAWVSFADGVFVEASFVFTIMQ